MRHFTKDFTKEFSKVFTKDLRQISETTFRVTDSSAVNFRSEKAEMIVRAALSHLSTFHSELDSKDWIVTSNFNENVYRVDKNYVNDVFERNPMKLGWFRPSSSSFSNEIPSKIVLSKSLDLSNANCREGSFQVLTNFIYE